jgi:hypothetical protein
MVDVSSDSVVPGFELEMEQPLRSMIHQKSGQLSIEPIE